MKLILITVIITSIVFLVIAGAWVLLVGEKEGIAEIWNQATKEVK